MSPIKCFPKNSMVQDWPPGANRRAVISSVWTRQNRLPKEPWRSAKRQALPSHRRARRFLSAMTPKMPISGFHRPDRLLPNWKKRLKCWQFALNWLRRNTTAPRNKYSNTKSHSSANFVGIVVGFLNVLLIRLRSLLLAVSLSFECNSV